MTFNVPYKVRLVLYLLISMGAPVVNYLIGNHIIGQAEFNLWSGLVTIITAMAALNTTPTNGEKK